MKNPLIFAAFSLFALAANATCIDVNGISDCVDGNGNAYTISRLNGEITIQPHIHPAILQDKTRNQPTKTVSQYLQIISEALLIKPLQYEDDEQGKFYLDCRSTWCN